MTTIQVLLALLRNALWGHPVEKELRESVDFARLSKVAKQQTVAGLIFGELVRRQFPLTPRDTLMAFGFTQRVAQANALLQHELANLVNVMHRKKLLRF